MDKTIREIAEQIGVSKTAVRKKIDNLGLRSSLRRNGNQFAVDEKTANIIITSFDKGNLSKTETKNENQFANETETGLQIVSALMEQLSLTKEQMELLKKELAIKNEQINELNERLKDTQGLLDHSQKMLDQQQHLHGLAEKRLIEQTENNSKLGWFKRRKNKEE